MPDLTNVQEGQRYLPKQRASRKNDDDDDDDDDQCVGNPGRLPSEDMKP